MRLIFAPGALAELREAAARYEEQRAGLGDDFLASVDATIQKVRRAPWRFSRLETARSVTTRRAVVKRYPYVVIYDLTETEINILAIAHSRRRPNYWMRRRKG